MILNQETFSRICEVSGYQNVEYTSGDQFVPGAVHFTCWDGDRFYPTRASRVMISESFEVLKKSPLNHITTEGDLIFPQ